MGENAQSAWKDIIVKEDVDAERVFRSDELKIWVERPRSVSSF